jgi:O-methyltransferase
MSKSREIISRHSLVSDQVDRDELTTILGELETVLERHVEGAVVEFGCYVGTTSLFLRRLLDAYESDKELHVYDSFSGLPPKGPEDTSPLGEAFVEGSLHTSMRELERHFTIAGLHQPVIHKGWFDELRPHDIPPTIAFAVLDGDFYQSIKTSLQLVWPQLARHGVLVVDDYDNDKLPGVARAVDEFFAQQTPIHIEQSLAIIRKT